MTRVFAALGVMFTVLVLVFGIAKALDLEIPKESGAAPVKAKFPPRGPAEFMYLDSARVAAYLAQVNGGIEDSKKLTTKLTNSLSAKAALAKAGEFGGSSAEEEFVERNVKPTAATSFFALRTALKEHEMLEPIRPGHFHTDVRGLKEGDFVYFKTNALASPRYLNAYLALLQAHSVASIFPRSEGRRDAARRFLRKVGREPRAVFVLRPYAAKKGDERRVRPKSFEYLLPVSVRLLTSERSLLKQGGGRLTVVGKLMRVFPRATPRHSPSYVDSGTLETWKQPLRYVLGELLCRTEPHCARRVRVEGLTGTDRQEAAQRARERVLRALKKQSRIPGWGAVILPIAIYK